MKNNILNPDSAMMQQVDGHWQKIAALMLAQYLKDTGRTCLMITTPAVEDFDTREDNVLLTHGHYDSMEFRLVTPSAASELVAYDAAVSGKARH